jgi:hypothetical protein
MFYSGSEMNSCVASANSSLSKNIKEKENLENKKTVKSKTIRTELIQKRNGNKFGSFNIGYYSKVPRINATNLKGTKKQGENNDTRGRAYSEYFQN